MSNQLIKTCSIDPSTTTQSWTKTTTLTWHVPNIQDYYLLGTTREIRSKIREDATASKFQLKMLLLGDYNKPTLQFYYLSAVPVFLHSVCLDVYRSSNETIRLVDCVQQVQANRWHYLHDLKRTSIDVSKRLNVKFTFVVINNMINIPEFQLSHDLGSILNNGLFSDVTFKSADNIEYKVHKLLLASRSNVLKAHFEHNTKECITNVIESPFVSEVLHEVLTYIYTDKAPRVDETPEKLLAAADYYQLGGLKSLCVEALHKKLTVENAIETLQLAELYSVKTLTQLTLEFIKDGQAHLIMETEAWTKLESVKMIKQLYKYILTDQI